MASSVRSRHHSGMASYLGTGKQMLPTELPTLRSTLRHGLLLQEEKRGQGGSEARETIPNLYKDMAIAVNNQWLKS